MTYFQVNMNIFTPTPPHLKPTPTAPDAYLIPMHTIQPTSVQVDMNVITPTPPHPNPTRNDPDAYYCGFLRACMVLVGKSICSDFVVGNMFTYNCYCSYSFPHFLKNPQATSMLDLKVF